MLKSNQFTIELSKRPLVVGVIHTPRSLGAALRLRAGAVDLFELRADAFAKNPEPLLRDARRLRAPLIVTVRHAAEGGAVKLSARQRREFFEEFLPHASAVDVELRSLDEMSALLALARDHGVRVILSHHDFAHTPSPKKLRDLAQRAARAQADIFKIATTANHAHDLATLLDFLTSETRLPLSVMAMGSFGKISRLLFAACGSVLNYGFLDTANATGQWPAPLLKTRIAEVETSAIR